jgi:predicted O-linked N-acetylglucosamine transferase (SPINDLY family)
MNRHQRRHAAIRIDGARSKLQLAARHLQAGRPAEAQPILQAVLAADERNPDALHLLGLADYAQGNLPGAADHVAKALAIAGRSPIYWNTLGTIRGALGQWPAARDCYRRAADLSPGDPMPLDNLGIALHRLGALAEAEQAYRGAIARDRGYAAAHANLGALLLDQRRTDEAADSLRRALQRDPNDLAARLSLARALKRQRRYGEALDIAADALRQDPDQPDAQTIAQECRYFTCDWSGYDALLDACRTGLDADPPYFPLEDAYPGSLPGVSRRHLLAFGRDAATRAARRAGPAPGPAPSRAFAPDPHGKIRIGYLSADFREHPVAQQMAAIFERHDRARFEVRAYSVGPDDGSAMRARLIRAFDGFDDIRGMTYAAGADRIAADGIDVLVDLTGHAQFSALEVLALRPAPVQAHFLGYPGTLGADFIDYVIVDPTVCPPAHAADYAETPAYLPDTYMPGGLPAGMPDTYTPGGGEAIAAPGPSRRDCGLPDDAFVFCCFNSLWKITPAMFDLWMGLLREVPGSVLWLRDFTPEAVPNLRAAAAARGIDAARLVFAERVDDPAQHLARLRCADLFLDTLPFNAHATATDALRAGVPLLTCMGDTFASRVAASVLAAAGLPELAARTLDDYRAQALRLARDPAAIGAATAKLAAALPACALFDGARFTRNLEAVYAAMWERHLRGEKPAPISVAPGA